MLDLSITGRADALAILEQTASPCPTARLASLGPRSRFILRGGDAAVAAASAAFGVEIPREPCRAAVAGDRAALWLGPDEWVLVAGEEEGPALGEALAAALADIPHSLTDVSHRSVAFTLAGRHAATVLNSNCPLDLSLDAFPVGACTRTLLGKAEIVLRRADEETFVIDVWRSFATYAWRLIEEGRLEYTL